MMTDVLQSAGIGIDLANKLRNCSAEAESNASLTNHQLEIIYQEKWFKIFVPKFLGGLALSLPEGVQLEEALAFIDGSLGWTVTLCAGASLFVGYLNQDTAATIFSDPTICFAGSGRNGRAQIQDDGYLVTGHWQWATGAPHATIFTANCIIEKDGTVQKNEDGTDQTRSLFFLRDEVNIVESWDTMGLKATAGHSFTVNDLQVSHDRTFSIDPVHTTLPDPIYQYPFLQFAEVTIAANTSGMALHFIALCEDLQKRKETSEINTLFGKMIAKAVVDLNLLRISFYQALQLSWNSHIAKEEGSDALLMVSRCSKELAQGARQIVQTLFPHCGMDGANNHTTINRVWRDIHTASQHALLR